MNGFVLSGVQPFVREKSYRPITFNPQPPPPPIPSQKPPGGVPEESTALDYTKKKRKKIWNRAKDPTFIILVILLTFLFATLNVRHAILRSAELRYARVYLDRELSGERFARPSHTSRYVLSRLEPRGISRTEILYMERFTREIVTREIVTLPDLSDGSPSRQTCASSPYEIVHNDRRDKTRLTLILHAALHVRGN